MQVLLEAKKVNDPLKLEHASQLFRYFAATNARIVRAIVCGSVPATRVFARDTKTYFGVLLDDNNRKPIARLWFNRSKKYLGVFDEQKVETRVAIDRVEDIYLHAELLRQTVTRYLGAPGEPSAA